MNTITFSDLTLEDLLPHRGHMLFVEKVLEVDSKQALTLCRVKKSWPMADEAGVPPFVVFGDKTLIEMASFLPRDETSLLDINGVGAKKLETYGADFLNIIIDY